MRNAFVSSIIYTKTSKFLLQKLLMYSSGLAKYMVKKENSLCKTMWEWVEPQRNCWEKEIDGGIND